MKSLAHAFKAAAVQYPGRLALVSADGGMDYQTLDLQSDRLAAALAQEGVVKGDRIGLYCMNCAFFVVAYVGILKAGATVVPINLLLNPAEVAYILDDAGAKALIYHAAFAEMAVHLRNSVVSLKFSIGMGGETEGAKRWEDMLKGDAPAPKIEFDAAEDIAAILYTSGTTGKPKGAMLTHANLLANTSSVQEAMQFRPGEDTVLVVLPMFHAFAATVGMLSTLFCGCTIAPLVRFEPELVARTIHETRATIFLGVPSMFTLLLRLKPESVALLESLRFCVSGGAALPVEVLQRFEALFGKTIYEGDGPTECSPVTCVNPNGGPTKPGTVGLPIPGVEMRIVGEVGVEPLLSGQVGEIAVRGPNVMKGYWNRPDDTREAFRDGWFLTGDLGTEDEDGYFSIVDRKKDLIIVNGMNVYPRVIEEVLYRFPAIREAAVVGEPHDLHGEIPIAYVSLLSSDGASEADIRAYCREHLGRHEIPRKIFILEELPKTATGKILKRELRKQGEVERGVKNLGDS
ncbi:MAG: long-chain fatty acid--CoA ligase [Methylococcaceae bacterium]|nr:long-chain fatty acid--CoA ligase [Methylococcaceae bacterium]